MVPSHRCQAEGIKNAGTAEEMLVSDKGCKSKDFYASRSIVSMLFVTLPKKKKKQRKHQHFLNALTLSVLLDTRTTSQHLGQVYGLNSVIKMSVVFPTMQ